MVLAIQIWPKEPLFNMLSEITYLDWEEREEQAKFNSSTMLSTSNITYLYTKINSRFDQRNFNVLLFGSYDGC